MRHLNIIGPAVIKMRLERGWSQDVLAARLQCQGDDISRDVLANLESGRTQGTDFHLKALQKAFGVRIIAFFPKSIQDLDEKFANRAGGGSLKPPRRRRR